MDSTDRKQEYIPARMNLIHRILDGNNLNPLLELESAETEAFINTSKDNDIRKVLNLGHTIGHALESYSYLSNGLDGLKHGEAIIVGLITELYISNKLNDFSLNTVDKLKEVSLNYFSRINLNHSNLKSIYDLMIFDKKNDRGSVNFILLDERGKPMIDQRVDKDIFINAFAYYNK